MLRYATEALQRLRDRLRRRFAMWIWDRPSTYQGPFRNSIVFVRWDAKLGDTVVLSWVFRELKRQRPDIELTVITGESFEDLFRRGYGIESVYLAGKRHGKAQLAQIAERIKHPKYVVHLSLKWRPRDIWFVNKLEAQHVVGLDDGLRMVDVKLGKATQGHHFSEKLVPWLEQLGIDTRERNYWIPRSPEAAASIEQWWPKGRVVGLCPYGASRKRHMSDEYIQAVVEAALANKETYLLLIGHHKQVESLYDRIDTLMSRDRILFKTSDNLFELFEQLARCDKVISIDTAVVHIAAGLSKPLLALYMDRDSQTENFRSWHPNTEAADSMFINSGEKGVDLTFINAAHVFWGATKTRREVIGGKERG